MKHAFSTYLRISLYIFVTVGLFFGGLGVFTSHQTVVYAEDCQFTGNIEDYKKCNPASGVASNPNQNLNVTAKADFQTIAANIIRRIQIFASVIAIGMIIWIGLQLVLPGNAEGKEQAKSKVITVLLGFLFMISATLIVNGIISIIYEIFK